MPFGQLPDRRPPFTHSRCALRNQIGEASDHPEADLLKLVEMPFAAFDLELFQGPQKREVDRARAAGVPVRCRPALRGCAAYGAGPKTGFAGFAFRSRTSRSNAVA
jgi:hypothetical protein